MEEYDEPLTLELRTEREVTVLFFALGLGAGAMAQEGRIKGAAACSNLQVRAATGDQQRVADALEGYTDGGVLPGMGAMSNEAALARLVEEGETDPEEVTEGGL